jgi:hypothetical protein
MARSDLLQEHWTDQRSAVVVTGEPKLIGQLLCDLQLPGELPVSVSDSKLALALWGHDISTYLEWRTRHFPNSNGSSGYLERNGHH